MLFSSRFGSVNFYHRASSRGKQSHVVFTPVHPLKKYVSNMSGNSVELYAKGKYLGSQGPDIWNEKLFRLLFLNILEFEVWKPV